MADCGTLGPVSVNFENVSETFEAEGNLKFLGDSGDECRITSVLEKKPIRYRIICANLYTFSSEVFEMEISFFNYFKLTSLFNTSVEYIPKAKLVSFSVKRRLVNFSFLQLVSENKTKFQCLEKKFKNFSEQEVYYYG